MDYNGAGFFGFIKKLQGDIVSIVPIDSQSDAEMNIEYDAWDKPIFERASSGSFWYLFEQDKEDLSMKVVVRMTYDADIIEVPNHIGENIKEYQAEFDEWLYNKNNDHPFWTYKDGEKYGVCYRSNAFVYWLNNVKLACSEYSASVFDSFLQKYDPKLPIIYF